MAEDDGKYATVGLKPNRSSTGDSGIWPQKLTIGDRNLIRQLMTRCEEAAKGYIPSNELVVCAEPMVHSHGPELEPAPSIPNPPTKMRPRKRAESC